MFVLSIFSLFGYCFAIKRISRWSIEIIPVFVISLLSSLLFVSALFGLISVVAKLLVIFGIGLLLFAPWYITQANWLTRYFTPGFLFIILFSIFFGTFAGFSHLRMWQEFAQWGARAKLIAMDHRLITHSTVLAHYAYPPGTAICYYWFFAFSKFSEGVTHLAQQLLILWPLGILVKDFTWDRWQRAFLVISFAVLILLLFHISMASNVTLSTDNIIGILFGAMLIHYYYSKHGMNDIFFLFPIAFFFTTITSGVIGILILFCAILIVDQCIFRSERPWKQIGAILLLLVVGLISYGSWPLFLYLNHIGVMPDIDILPHWPLSSRELALATYYLKVIEHHIPAVVAILLIIAANILLSEEKERRNRVITIHICMFIGYVLYLLFLLNMYIFGYVDHGAHYFSSFWSYMKIYNIAWGLLALGTMLPEWRHSYFGRQAYVTGFFIGFALLAFPAYLFYGHYLHIKKSHAPYSLFQLRQALIPMVAATEEETPPHSSIFIIWQNSKGFERTLLGYLLIPRSVNSQPSSFGQPYSAYDRKTKDYSQAELKQAMEPYDYVLLAYTDEQFWKKYGVLFSDPDKHQLVQYLICKRDGYDGFGKPGCWTQAAVAYLYSNQKGSIQ